MLKLIRTFLLSSALTRQGIGLAVAMVVILHGFAAAALHPQGDLTGDCKVDWKDIQIFAEQWLDSSECEELPCAGF